MPETTNDVITDALREIGVLNAVDLASGEDATLGLVRLNGILDLWNTRRATVYGDVLYEFSASAAVQPHTIGIAADAPTWTVTGQRPVSIEAASLVSGGVRYPIRIHDLAWWHAQPMPELTGDWPTDLAYDPTWPNGRVFLWPDPTASLDLELLVRHVLAQLALGTTFTMPPGYRRALMLTLAEDLSVPFRVALSPKTEEKARQARDLVFGVNRKPQALATADFGLGGGGGDDYDYRLGPLG